MLKYNQSFDFGWPWSSSYKIAHNLSDAVLHLQDVYSWNAWKVQKLHRERLHFNRSEQAVCRWLMSAFCFLKFTTNLQPEAILAPNSSVGQGMSAS